MYSKLLSWSRGLYLAGIVLALVLVIPTAWFPFQLAKVAVFAVFLLASAVLLVWGRGVKEVVRSHGFSAALLVGLLPVAYLISMFFSIDKSVAFAGFGVESDTVLFVLILFLAFMLAFAYFRTLRTVRLLLSVVFWALIAACIFQGLSIVFGAGSILPTFADRSVNLIGKWNDLGLMAGLLTMFILVRLELATLTTPMRAVLAVAAAALVVLIGIINFSLIWVLILVFCVILAIVRFLVQRAESSDEPQTWVNRIPWYSAIGVALAVLFLFFGTAFNTSLTTLFPVSSLEVRPSYDSTLGIIGSARGGSFERVLVGTGPNTFGQEWLQHKPTEVNQSPFWNLDFNVGFSTFITALGTVGLLGILAWLIPLFLVLAALVRVVRLGVLNREDKIVTTTLAVSSLFLLSSVLLYVPSQNIILLAFVFAGATFGFLWRQGQASISHDEETSRRSNLGVLVAMVALIVLTLWSGVASSRRLVAIAYADRGIAALGNNDIAGALSDASRSIGIEKNGDALRLAIQAQTAELQLLAAATSTPSTEVQQQFASAVQSAISAGQSAQALNPMDYRPTLTLAQLYDYLASLNVQGALQTASTTYTQAAKLNPTNPAIPLALTRLAAASNDTSATTAYLSQALTLKQNYTDAILFVVQLDVANKDIPSAIKAATAAAQTAPGVAPIWFELGLLYYSAGDATNATAALEQAVSIQKDYANAKYFLGLSYYLGGKTPEAIQQFRDLSVSNPDNAEVKLILSNLTSGHKPFDGATPPVTATPEDRSTAPISQ